MKFQTESGTIYEVANGRWRRVSSTERSGQTRRDDGVILGFPYIRLGEPAIIEDTDVLPGCARHLIETTPVVKVWADA